MQKTIIFILLSFLMCIAVIVLVQERSQYRTKTHPEVPIRQLRESNESLHTKETVDAFIVAVNQGNYEKAFGFWQPKRSEDNENIEEKVIERSRRVVGLLQRLKFVKHANSSFFDNTLSYEPYYPESDGYTIAASKELIPKQEVPLSFILKVWKCWGKSTDDNLCGSYLFLEKYEANIEENVLRVTFYLVKGEDGKPYLDTIVIDGPNPLLKKLYVESNQEFILH